MELQRLRGRTRLALRGLAEFPRGDVGRKTKHSTFYSPTIYKAGNITHFPFSGNKSLECDVTH
jgi:hypothetical protein